MADFKIGRGLDIEVDRDSRRKSGRKDRDNFLIAKYLNVGYYLLAPLLLGVFFGLIVDRTFHTRPIFTIGFILVGVVATFYNLGKIIREI